MDEKGNYERQQEDASGGKRNDGYCLQLPVHPSAPKYSCEEKSRLEYECFRVGCVSSGLRVVKLFVLACRSRKLLQVFASTFLVPGLLLSPLLSSLISSPLLSPPLLSFPLISSLLSPLLSCPLSSILSSSLSSSLLSSPLLSSPLLKG
jgi:hypothetical protein